MLPDTKASGVVSRLPVGEEVYIRTFLRFLQPSVLGLYHWQELQVFRPEVMKREGPVVGGQYRSLSFQFAASSARPCRSAAHFLFSCVSVNDFRRRCPEWRPECETVGRGPEDEGTEGGGLEGSVCNRFLTVIIFS